MVSNLLDSDHADMSLSEVAQIYSRINAIAIKIAPDYPNIAGCSTWEQLYAIETSYEGSQLAIGDLHASIKKLGEKFGMSKEQLVDFLLEVWKERQNVR